MSEAYRSALASQFRAALAMLEDAIEKCPDEAWNAPVANQKFCQAAFHVLFYTDFYLEPGEATFPAQPFHVANADFFADYEEL